MSEAYEPGEDATKVQAFPLKDTMVWFLLGSLAVLWVMTVGASPRHQPYLDILLEEHWLVLEKFIGACLFSFIIPLPHALISLATKKMRNRFSVSRIYRGWYMALVAFVALGVLAAGVTSTARASSSEMEYELPQSTKVDGFRLAFACGNLVRRLSGDEAASKIHGFAVANMVSEKLALEEGSKLINEAGAFTKYAADFYADDRDSVEKTRLELCSQAKLFFPNLPI